MIPESMTMILQNNGSFDIMVDHLKNSVFKSMLLRQGVRYTIRHKLAIGNTIYGFVAVDYLDVPKNLEKVRDEYKDVIANIAHSIEIDIMRLKSKED